MASPHTSWFKSSSDIVTSMEETKAGFINFALEKNRRSTPMIAEAKDLRYKASSASCPQDLVKIAGIRSALLTASGLSDKALKYFNEEDKLIAINELIKNYLEPAGSDFVNEVVYRFLLIKGDSLGGQMRNVVGYMAQQKLVYAILASLNNSGTSYTIIDENNKIVESGAIILEECNVKSIIWKKQNKQRILIFNKKIPIVGKNVDICLFDYANSDIDRLISNPSNAILFGELKGGIDPAGADEHWKTGNSALNRIRESYSIYNKSVLTAFIGAAIADSMAEEIFNQVKNNTLSYAANLTKDNQLIEFCNWMLTL